MAAGRRRRNLEQERARRALARLEGERDVRALAAAVQAVLGYVAPVTLDQIADHAGATREAVREAVAADESLCAEPPARSRVTICTGRTCARRGGASLVRLARRVLAVGVFETTADGAIRLEPFSCFGQCAMAPNVRIDGRVRGAMGGERLARLLEMLRRRAAERHPCAGATSADAGPREESEHE